MRLPLSPPTGSAQLSRAAAAIRVRGRLAPEALETALRTSAARWLSSPTGAEGRRPVLAVTRHDLDGLREDERAEREDKLLCEALREPFEPGLGPLARACLVHSAPEEHLLLLALAPALGGVHLAESLLKETVLAYEAAGSTSPVVHGTPPVTTTRSDPAPAAPTSTGSGSVTSSPLLELPLDRPRPTERDPLGELVFFEVPVRSASSLRRLARECGAGPEASVFALYLVLLHRYSGQSDLSVAVLADRSAQSRSAEAPSPFHPTFALAKVTGKETFRELVGAARSALADAAGATLPSGEAAPAEPPGETVGGRPGFSYHQAPRVDGLTTLDVRFVPFHSRVVVSDMELRLTDTGDGLSCQLAYATDVLNESTVLRARDHLLRLVEGVTEDPDRPVATLPLLTTEEERVIEARNSLRSRIPEQTFPQLFEEQASRVPDDIAVRAEDTSLSYRELNLRANQLAHLLREHGVGPEVTVGLRMERGAAMVVAVLGVLKAGGAYVPLDPEEPAERQLGILDDAEVTTVVTAGASEPFNAGSGRRVIGLDSEWTVLEGRKADNPTHCLPSPTDAAYLLYTSGSTGRPKGVVIEHRQLISYTHAVIERLSIDEPLRFAMVQPLTVDSSVTALVPPLCTGGEVQPISRESALDANRLADWTVAWGVDCLKIAPSHLRALQSSPRFADLMPRRLLVVGGEPSDWRWLRGIQRSFPHCRVFNHYGPTEATVGVLTLAVADHPDEDWDTAPIGYPLPNTRAHVVDEAGQEVPTGVAGELLLGGSNLARSYHRREDLTVAAFVPDTLGNLPGERLYRTGDIVRRLADGNIVFLGRRDDQVKVRGFRVELGEIDAALMSHPEVGNSVTIVREDVPGNRRVVSYVEPHGRAALDVAAVERHLRDRLPAHMIPQALVSLDRLPLSKHGKVARGELPPVPTVPRKALPPANELERRVADAWQRVLSVESVGMEQNFFDLGGHSLLLVELQHLLRSESGVAVELLDLFQYTTVRAQAALFSKEGENTAVASDKPGGAQKNALLKRRQRQLRAKRGQA